MTCQLPDLHVPFSRTSDKKVLTGVHGQGFDGRIVCLECVQQLPLTDVKNTDESLPAARDDQLLLRSVLKNGRTILMTLEGVYHGVTRSDQCVP